MSDSITSPDLFAPTALTYDDVLLLPGLTDVIPSEVDTTSRLTKSISLSTPLLSAAMDTVTESDMAIAMARQGGIGILHRNLSIEDQAQQVRRVKRSESGMVSDPVTIGPQATIAQLDELCGHYKVSGLPVVDSEGNLLGIITNRDLRFVPAEKWASLTVRECMTPRERLITGPTGISREDAKALLAEHRIEKLPLVDAAGRLTGLITVKDFVKTEQYPRATKDEEGRLVVGAAVGYWGDTWERAGALAEAGVDVIVVDTAHGHQDRMLEAVAAVRAALPASVPIAAGNVVTAAGVRDLVGAGASIVKVGVGPGAMCTTRMQTGVGRPQFSAVLECSRQAARLGAHVWADGGVRHPRDVALALAAGASNVMVGSWFAGTHESPGDIQHDADSRPYKVSFGMASTRAVMDRTEGEAAFDRARKALFEEGISAGRMYLDPARPGVEDLIDSIVAGVRSSFTYAGAASIPEFRARAVVGIQSASGYREGAPVPVSW